MPAVGVQLFATLRELTGTSRLTVEASSVREVLSFLVRTYEGLSGRLLTPAGDLQETVAVLVNGRNIRFLQGLDTALAPGDMVTLIPPVAGGHPGQASVPHSRVLTSYVVAGRVERTVRWDRLLPATGSEPVSVGGNEGGG